MKAKHTLNKVHQVALQKNMSVTALLNELAKSGVMGGGRLGRAADIMESMIQDKDCKLFLGIAGALIPGGMRSVILDMLESGHVDVLVTTGAMLTHDLAEALGYSHLQGRCDADDEELNKKHLDRMFDSYMPNQVYEGMEDFFEKHYAEWSSQIKIKDLLWCIGKLTPARSILKICYEKQIPVFCPALADSGIGLMIWGQISQGKKCAIKAFDDMHDIISIAWDAKKTGVVYLGGGVPKNFIQQAMQFSKGATYGVQITMDRPEHGGSSGAPLKEGISWGKLNPKGNYVDVICDSTIALPLLWAAVKSRV